MIRRDWPLGVDAPQRWVLITQPEHARLSHELAAAWGSTAAPALVCPAGEPDHPLAGVRSELLEAIRHHDDGWDDRLDSPRFDPRHDRPYSFTEMPSADSQRIWTDSIDACRAIGPFPGWVVASHFLALHAKRDGDHPEWNDWVNETERLRAEWLAEWRAASPLHTGVLAQRCLAWLQAFDWMTLWLGLRAPALDADLPATESLVIGGGSTGWPRITFSCLDRIDGHAARLGVDPWPFSEGLIQLLATAVSMPVDRSGDAEPPAAAFEQSIAWSLVPPENRGAAAARG